MQQVGAEEKRTHSKVGQVAAEESGGPWGLGGPPLHRLLCGFDAAVLHAEVHDGPLVQRQLAHAAPEGNFQLSASIKLSRSRLGILLL